ncbi:endoplasmic reticulum Oxidoreductin 1-domain-containing protein [Lipomyces arxii]|uniref:endoplasmic reticulum Oxidoreductin 1-domain-containing protein n=1 Tax=Lipomyces arxii TaxID=56418 RepID=UPI0034CF54E0
MLNIKLLATGTIAFLATVASCASTLADEISESAYEISAINIANSQNLRPLLDDIVTTDFFRYYRLDLFGRPCQFWSDEGMCGNRACAVDTIDDEDSLPEIWKSEYLGELSYGSTYDSDELEQNADVEESCVQDSDPSAPIILRAQPLDYCVPEDESEEAAGVYVSLIDNPERYTGYMGAHANMIWQAIYTENCFPEDSAQIVDQVASSGESLGNVVKERNTCIEKRVFYKLVSGMHASVSTHLCNEYLDPETNEWGPNLALFMFKVGNYPDRIANVYFNYALVAKAVAKLRNYMEDFTFCTNAQGYDAETRNKMLRIAIEADKSIPDLVDSKRMFINQPELKEEFRTRFVNVSRIMDCTGCDKCRLWGKLQVTGYATALKILFDLPDDKIASDIHLRRMEMVALINTFHRLSKSVTSINMFREMLAHPDGLPSDDEHGKIFEPESKATQDQDNTSLGQVWDEEWNNVYEAVKFVVRSYIELPQNLWRITIYHADRLWTRFTGRDRYGQVTYTKYYNVKGKDEL